METKKIQHFTFEGIYFSYPITCIEELQDVCRRESLKCKTYGYEEGKKYIEGDCVGDACVYFETGTAVSKGMVIRGRDENEYHRVTDDIETNGFLYCRESCDLVLSTSTSSRTPSGSPLPAQKSS